MYGSKVFVALAFAAMLQACNQSRTPEEQPESSTAPSPVVMTNEMSAVSVPSGAAVAGKNDRADPLPPPPHLTPEAERGEKGARNMLLSFARFIEMKHYGQAWAMLSASDRKKWSEQNFAKLFADLDRVIVAIPTGTMEGAAGSSYYTAPVSITGSSMDGRPVRFEGNAVLRRVNDVDGATDAQLRWHFESLTLDWTH